MHFLHIGENIVLAINIWYKEWSSQVIYTTLGGGKKDSQSQQFALVGPKKQKSLSVPYGKKNKYQQLTMVS